MPAADAVSDAPGAPSSLPSAPLAELAGVDEDVGALERALNQAWTAHQAGQTARAVAMLDAALAAPPEPGRPVALAVQRAQAALCVQRGVWCQALGRAQQAGVSLAQAARWAPGWALAWRELGVFHLRQAQWPAALQALRQADQLAPGEPATLRQLAQVLARQGRPDAALQAIDQALQRLQAAPSASRDGAAAEIAATLADRSAVLSTLGRLDEALHSARQARQSNPASAPGWTNEAAVLLRLQQPAPALASALQALQLAPGDVAAAANRVRALHLLGQTEEALHEAQRLTQARPDAARAWDLRLGLTTLAGRWAEAAEAGEQLLRLAPATPWAAGRWLHARGKLCRWAQWSAQVAQHAQAVAAGQPVAVPFGLLALLDDPALQRQAAQCWLRRALPQWPTAVAGAQAPAPPLARAHLRRPGPWRVGWLSADFHAHATARLLAGTFEAMDSVYVEHHALSITAERPADPMQQRLRAALPHWHELQALDDLRAAQAVATLELDVLVDLGGLTRGARPGLLARRPAPWQVAYLGFMGCSSTPAPQAVADAVLADDTLVPAAHTGDLNEGVLHLPGGMWPREAALPAAQAQALSRAMQAALDPSSLAEHTAFRLSLGLPAQGFVFCNFGDATKLNPPLFDVWMRLLQAVPGSVLWLRQGTAEMAVRLQAEAAQRGVSPQRLVWAQRLPWLQHLQRHVAADLFLDSWPCNGHTTVADALLAGLPVLTLKGRTMAARVAASQLQTLGLQALVCEDPRAYEQLAVELTQQPRRLAALRGGLHAALPVHTGPRATAGYAEALLATLLGQRGTALRAPTA